MVRLYDIFQLNEISFCTVLEYCSGGDLDEYIKRNLALTVRESRVIIAQVAEGLSYLHSQSQPVIHYDLKPGNILFDSEVHL